MMPAAREGARTIDIATAPFAIRSRTVISTLPLLVRQRGCRGRCASMQTKRGNAPKRRVVTVRIVQAWIPLGPNLAQSLGSHQMGAS
jgi:hypothetical protein